MDSLRTRRMRRLTQAVFDGAAAERHDPADRRQVRILPSPITVVMIVVLLVLLTIASVVRMLGSAPAGAFESSEAVEGSSDTTEQEAAPASSMEPIPQPSALFSESAAEAGHANVFVYVTGQVGAPGVIELDAGSRVIDAVIAAGGTLEDADVDAVNMARVLVDGEHIVVWRIGEAPPYSGSAPGGGGSGGVGGAAATGTECVDINTADSLALQTLDGVGPALAGRIITYRQDVGLFGSVEELDNVSGIGPALVGRIAVGVCP